MGSQDPTQQWYTTDRRAMTIVGAVIAVLGLLNLGVQAFGDEPDPWLVALALGLVVVGTALAWTTLRRRVRAERAGLSARTGPVAPHDAAASAETSAARARTRRARSARSSRVTSASVRP